MNSEHGKNGEVHMGFGWFRPPESKPYIQYGGGIMRRE
jgi:hypothetical protein